MGRELLLDVLWYGLLDSTEKENSVYNRQWCSTVLFYAPLADFEHYLLLSRAMAWILSPHSTGYCQESLLLPIWQETLLWLKWPDGKDLFLRLPLMWCMALNGLLPVPVLQTPTFCFSEIPWNNSCHRNVHCDEEPIGRILLGVALRPYQHFCFPGVEDRWSFINL